VAFERKLRRRWSGELNDGNDAVHYEPRWLAGNNFASWPLHTTCSLTAAPIWAQVYSYAAMRQDKSSAPCIRHPKNARARSKFLEKRPASICVFQRIASLSA